MTDTWTVIGPAPSKGDGARIYLRCRTCGSMSEVRKRTHGKGWTKPCLRCAANTKPSNTDRTETT